MAAASHGPTTRSLEERIDDLAADLRGDVAGLRVEMTAEFGKVRGELGMFRAEVRTQLGFIKALGVFFGAILVANFGGALGIAWNASTVVSDVKHQGDRLEKVEKRLDGVKTRLDGVDKRLEGMDAKLDMLIRRSEPKTKGER